MFCRVAAPDELDAAQPARIAEFAHIEVFAAPDHGLHHVLLSALAARLHDFPGTLQGGAGRDGAGHMLARAKGGNGLRGDVVDGRVDMHRVHGQIPDQVLKRRVPLLTPNALPIWSSFSFERWQTAYMWACGCRW